MDDSLLERESLKGKGKAQPYLREWKPGERRHRQHWELVLLRKSAQIHPSQTRSWCPAHFSSIRMKLAEIESLSSLVATLGIDIAELGMADLLKPTK